MKLTKFDWSSKKDFENEEGEERFDEDSLACMLCKNCFKCSVKVHRKKYELLHLKIQLMILFL